MIMGKITIAIYVENAFIKSRRLRFVHIANQDFMIMVMMFIVPNADIESIVTNSIKMSIAYKYRMEILEKNSISAVERFYCRNAIFVNTGCQALLT